MDLGEYALAVSGGGIEVPPFGGRNEGGWDRGDRDTYFQEVEQGSTVHSYYTHYVPIPGYGEDYGIAETKSVVGT